MFTDTCERKAHCLDGICKCAFGFGILDRGDCERLPFDPTNIEETVPSATLTHTPRNLPITTRPQFSEHRENAPQKMNPIKPLEKIKELIPQAIQGVSKIIDWSMSIPREHSLTLPPYHGPGNLGNSVENSNDVKPSIEEPVTITLPPPAMIETRPYVLINKENSVQNFGSFKAMPETKGTQTILPFIQNPNRNYVPANQITQNSISAPNEYQNQANPKPIQNNFASGNFGSISSKKPEIQENSAQNPGQFKSMPEISQKNEKPETNPNQPSQPQNQANSNIFNTIPAPPFYNMQTFTSTSQPPVWSPVWRETQETTRATFAPVYSELPRPAPAQPIYVGLGQKCIPGLDRCPENAHCIVNCICLPEFKEISGRCVKDGPLSYPKSSLLSFGSSCRIKDDCEGGSECLDGLCKCPMKTTWKEGRCLKDSLRRGIATPGESCERGEICAGGSMCDYVTKKCICAANHDAVRGTCMRNDCPYMVLPGGSCRSENLCIGGSTCEKGTCTCDPMHHAVDGYCRPLTSKNSDVEFVMGAGLRFSSSPQGSKKKAQRCPLPEEPQKCELPNCFCSKYGRAPPGDLDPKDIPQFIVLTFDDAVNAKTMTDYKFLFEENHYRNPNGCPIKGSFFVSHEWTNYDDVQWIFKGGHELASNSITHSYLQGRGITKWLNEMDGQRRIMAKFGNIPEEEIVGLRAPQLAVGGDEQFEMMLRDGFLYDNSISANPGIRDAPYWPQTLDYKLAWQCQEKDCPTSSFPGIWTIPLNQFYGNYLNQISTYKRASMLRAAVEDNSTVVDLYQLLTMNFERAYLKNKAPYVLSLNADFLQIGGTTMGLEALTRFLDTVMQKHDVYVVTLKSLIKWMQNPKSLKELDLLDDFKCNKNGTAMHSFSTQNTSPLCSQPNKCIFPTPFLPTGEHQFQTCNPCPSMYPWIDNPMGLLEY